MEVSKTVVKPNSMTTVIENVDSVDNIESAIGMAVRNATWSSFTFLQPSRLVVTAKLKRIGVPRTKKVVPVVVKLE